MIVPLYLWIPGECNDFVVMFSGMDEWVNEYEWMKKKLANKQTNKQTKPLYEDMYCAFDTVGLGYNPGKLTKCKWFW